MSFAAEPYGVFVDDLLTNLTGGVTREAFRFLPENAPFRLGHPSDALSSSIRVHGLVNSAFHRFVRDRDFDLGDDGVLSWRSGADGTPAPEASWPDRGSQFYVSYERRPEARPAPQLTDRNPGSIVRLLAESFAREYAVLSKQLEKVYRAGFLVTAEGRDLDQLVALVGIERRTRTSARGEVVFSRTTPATGNIFIPAGTRISTNDNPPATVETLEDRVLRTGTLSVETPVQALTPGPDGAAPAAGLTVLHRPILGIDRVTNPQPLTLGGSDESDQALRRRGARALETSGRATLGALTGALSTIEGVREQDVRIVTDHLSSPGTVKITVASELSDRDRQRAAELIRDYKPAGIRIVHNLDVPTAPALPPSAPAGPSGGPGAGTAAGVGGGIWFTVEVQAGVTPADADLALPRKAELKQAVEQRIRSFMEARGVGETLVYNRLVSEIMAVDGVYDLALTARAQGDSAGDGRSNLVPSPPDTRPRLGQLSVTIRGALVAFDVTVQVELLGLAATGDTASALADVREDVIRRLGDIVAGIGEAITPSLLEQRLTATDSYRVEAVSYTVEFMDEGLRVRRANVTIELDPDQSPWIRTLSVVEEATS
jgi:uncharacterized phage protein gp47/JayE